MTRNNTRGIHSDKEEIDKITKEFFGIFTNTDHTHAQWERIPALCIPEILLIKKTGGSQEIYNLDSFIEPRRKMLSDGTLSDFEEHETEEETKISNNMAQRFSKYQKSGLLNGKRFKEQGHKFFHFIKTTNGWRITSVIWEDDAV